jgi:signal transduction histidine kinase
MATSNRSAEFLTGRARAPGAPTLSASVAHEINNPLESLLNLLYLLEAEPALSQTGRHVLALAVEEVRRVAEIAREALARHVAVVMKEASMVELLNGILDFYEQRLDSAGICIEKRYSGENKVPALVGPLREVFGNLLLNAADAMPDGGKVHVRVCTAREHSGEERAGVRVTIADTGAGIPAHLRRQIFQPYFTTKSAGSGMGLPLVRDIVLKHHGVLHFKSSTNAAKSGTVFTIFLPAA